MPNRQIVNGERYRYAFQGQEKDPETGKEAFQLRLWDARIGRWLTTDPAGQHPSPYLGMGNNPISRIDPDGGLDWYADGNGELEWHQGSDVIEGLMWAASDGTSNADLSRIESWLGGDGNIPGYFSGLGDFFSDLGTTLTTEKGWLGIIRGMEATSMNMDTNPNSTANVEGRESINGTINSFTHALNNFEDYPAYAYGYGTGSALPALASRSPALARFAGVSLTSKAIFQSSTLGYRSRLFGRYSKAFLPDGRMGALNNKNNFIRVGWGPGVDSHVFRLGIGSNKSKIHWHFDAVKYKGAGY